MVSLGTAIQDAVRPAFCTLTRPAAATLGIYSRYLDAVGLLPTQDLLVQQIDRVRGIRNIFCSETPDNALPAAPVPFTGGQCPGTIYFVSADAVINGNPPVFAGSGTGPGPIRLDTGPQEPSGEFAVLLDANGNFLSGGGTSIPPGTFELVNIQVIPQGGGPNDCGDPPRTVPPYNPNNFTTPVDITFDDDNTGNPVTISPTLVFAPVNVGVDADFTVPFNLELSPEINLAGELNLSTGDVTYNNTANIELNIPDGPIEVPIDQPLENTGLKIIGARVISVVNPDVAAATERQQQSPSLPIWLPRLGNLTFRYTLPDGSIIQGDDLQVKFTDQVFWADRVAFGAVFSPEDGVSSVVRLIVVTAENCDSCSG